MKKVNKKLSMLLVFCLAATGIMFTTMQVSGVDDKTIAETFADLNMAQAVADEITSGDVDAVITQQMVDSTIILNLPMKGIRDLSGITTFVNLKELRVPNNDIVTLPDNIGELHNLDKLDIDDNKIISLPESIGDLSNLTYLHAQSNKIESLPESIGNLSSMENLDFTMNQISVIPNSIVNLTKLTGVSFAYNKLSKIPEDIGKLTNLSNMQIMGNQITNIPESIGNLSNLRILSLFDNKLTSLPDTITNLSNLVYIAIGDNSLTSLPQKQYNFIMQDVQTRYISEHEYTETILQPGYQDTEFSFDALPSQTQFLNYGVSFAYTLKQPDETIVSIQPTISNGKIVIDASFLTQIGEYNLITDGTGANETLAPIHYEQVFTILKTQSFPVIELIGDNPMKIDTHSVFEEPGYIATDEIDGDITENVVVTGMIDTTMLGKYTLTYTITNSSGNTVSVTRDIKVVDTENSGKKPKKTTDKKDDIPDTGDTTEFTSMLVLLSGALLYGGYSIIKKRKAKA